MSERPHCLWESPDGQTVVYLAFEVIDTVNAAIADALAKGSFKGSEAGGLLLGKAEMRACLTVWIDRIELLPCRYARGPSFYLDPEDAPDLTKPEIVGFFRSHTRKDLFLGPDDLSLTSQHFSRPDQVVLLVKPFQTRANLGGFFLWRDGKIDGATSPREFPFQRKELGGGEPVFRASRLPDPPQMNYPENPEDASGVVQKRTKPPILLWAMFLILGSAGLSSLGYLLLNRTKPIQVTTNIADSSLRLNAVEGNGSITLYWDKELHSVASAAKAIVEIQEGTFQKKLEMKADQLHRGRIIYSRPVAIADTISFHLQIFPEHGAAISESIDLVSNRPITLPSIAAKPVEFPRPPASSLTAAPKSQTFVAAAAKVSPPPVKIAKPEASKIAAPKAESSPIILRPAPR